MISPGNNDHVLAQSFLAFLECQETFLQSTPPSMGFWPIKGFSSIHLYTWVEKSTVRVECLGDQNTTQCPRPGLTPRLINPHSSALNITPPQYSKFNLTPLICLLVNYCINKQLTLLENALLK